MTFIMAARADGGVAAISDRKEGCPDREVTKCHMDGNGGFYIALAGDGRTASGLLRRIAEDKTVQAAGIEERIRDLVASIYEQGQPHAQVDGIYITAGSQGYRIYDLYVSDGHADLCPNYDATSMHGDYAAISICRSLTANLNITRKSPGEAAAILHILASKVATTVGSVGGREKYGFDLAVLGALGSAELFKRCTDKLGTLEILFRIDPAGGQASTGEKGGQAHG